MGWGGESPGPRTVPAHRKKKSWEVIFQFPKETPALRAAGDACITLNDVNSSSCPFILSLPSPIAHLPGQVEHLLETSSSHVQ